MNLFNRAFISITRNLGKFGLLFLIVLILGSVISGAISTNRAVENMATNLTGRMLPVAMVRIDWKTFRELSDNPGATSYNISADLLHEIGDLPYVQSYDIGTSVALYGRFEVYEPELEEEDMVLGGWWSPGEIFGNSFNFRSVQNPNITDIEQNVIELVEGRVFTLEEINNISFVALISEEFAALNRFSVGSIMSFRNIEFKPEAMNMGRKMTDEDIFLSESYDIEVVGIFRIMSFPTHDDPWINMFMSREMYNRIYIPNSFAIMASRIQNAAMREFHPQFFNTVEGLGEGEDYIWWENFFTLYDPNEFPQFREAVATIMPPYFEVLDTGDSLRPILLALDTMKGLSFTVLIVAIGVALVILTLLINLFLRDRKKELGIYMSLGKKRSKIISLLLLEVMPIAFLSIAVSLFIGNIIANSISENMLMNDIATEQELASGTGDGLWDFDYFANMGFDTEIPTYVIEASYDVSLSFPTALIFLSVGLGTVLLATVVPIIYILRLNPKEIML